MPLAHRGVFLIRANGGHVNYRYDSDELFADDTDHSRYSFFGIKAELARNTLDKFLYPRKGSDMRLSGIFVTGRDKYEPFNADRFLSRTSRQWVGARLTWDKYFDMPGSRVVLAGRQRRRRDHEPSRIHHGRRDADVDACLYAGFACADDLHARLPGQAVRGGRRDADFRPDAQLLPAHGFLYDVPRQTRLCARIAEHDRGRTLALYRRGVAGLLHQFVGHEGDDRRHDDRPRIPENICLFVSLRRRRHRLLARRGGQLHQQDAVHLQDKQRRRVGIRQQAGEPLHPRKRASHTVQAHDLRGRRDDRHPLHAAGEKFRRTFDRGLQPRPEGCPQGDGLADP